ncbi:FOG: Ankyrin repeat [Alteromonadaceae bacterium Bs31]|nr:FOG: Ankyrin repeat [Alteromonadaceae bacterium Bs31]
MSYYVEISVREAEHKIVADPKALILDARDAHSYKDNHIEGAMQAHGGLVEHLLASKQIHRPVLVYCYHGTSSKELAEVFGRAGFTESYSMRGGYTAWKKRRFLYTDKQYSTITNEWLLRECFEEQSLNASIDGHISPLMLACQQGQPEIVSELLIAGADKEMRNADGNTALWFASYAGCEDSLNLLIDAGADINAQNGEGFTALMYASSAGKTSVVKLLQRKGADLELSSRDDFTALDLAANAEILNFLKPLYREPVL